MRQLDPPEAGLICVWDKNFFQFKDKIIHRYFILLIGSICHNSDCIIGNIYTPTDVNERKEMWEELCSARTQLSLHGI